MFLQGFYFLNFESGFAGICLYAGGVWAQIPFMSVLQERVDVWNVVLLLIRPHMDQINNTSESVYPHRQRTGNFVGVCVSVGVSSSKTKKPQTYTQSLEVLFSGLMCFLLSLCLRRDVKCS